MSSELIGILGVGVALLGVGVALASLLVTGLRGVEKRMGARIDSLERRVDALEARMTGRMDALEQKLEDRLDVVENRLLSRTWAGKARRADCAMGDPPRREVVEFFHYRER